MKKFLLLLLVTVGLSACFKDSKEFLRSYVMYYYDAAEMDLTLSYGNNIDIYFGELSSLGDYKSTGALKKSYDALCEKHNDMTFLRDFVVRDAYGPHSTEQLGLDFLSIDIVSDSDFDAEHPTNTSLSDVVMFYSYSLKPFIDSHYELRYNGGVYHPIEEKISNLSANQLVLLGRKANVGFWPMYIGTLVFEKEPDLSKTHTFTVTMTADDGRIFTASIDMEFE